MKINVIPCTVSSTVGSLFFIYIFSDNNTKLPYRIVDMTDYLTSIQ